VSAHDPRACLSVVPVPGAVEVRRHHPSADSKLARSQGYVVASVTYRTVDGVPDAETLRYAREFAAAPRMLAALKLANALHIECEERSDWYAPRPECQCRACVSLVEVRAAIGAGTGDL
jgi:hypothetical protein